MVYGREKAPSRFWEHRARRRVLQRGGRRHAARVITVALALDAVFKSLLRALWKPKNSLRASKVTRHGAFAAEEQRRGARAPN